MKNNTPLYAALTVVFLASFGLALYLPTTEMLKGISGLPAVGALFMALWTSYRDDAAHRRLLELEKHKQLMNLSVTSHMAEVAFDKHVVFCEEYIQCLMQSTFTDAEKFSQELKAIRDKHTPWVSSKINDELSACEVVWRQFGVSTKIVKETSGELRDEYNGIALKLFDVLVGTPGNPANHQKLVILIQDFLGVDELTELRTNLVQEATKALTSWRTQ